MSYLIALLVGLALGVAIHLVIAYLERLSRQRGRPIGLTIIAMLQFGIGVVALIAFCFATASVLTRYEELQVKLRPVALSPEQVLAGLLMMSALALMASIGLWYGTPRGWKIAVFAIGCGVARNLISLMLDWEMIAALGHSGYFYYLQHGCRAGVGVVMLIYLYRAKVLRYCSLPVARLRHTWALLNSLAASIALEWLLRQLGH